jgi:hypothetical protein
VDEEPAVIENPYSNDSLSWYKGNLHSHTRNSDGMRDPQQVVKDYARAGYAFLMISDHDFFTDPASLDRCGMTLIPGAEVSIAGPHILHVDARRAVEPDSDRQRVINAARDEGGFAIVCHPNWEKHFSHCPQALLETWRGYAGIEIYNGVIRRLDGSPIATDRWDRLLGLGRRVWGYANDDSHRPEDDGIAANVVQAANNTSKEMLDALRAGRFYATTGVVITEIKVEDNTIWVETTNAERIIVHSDFGHRLLTADGKSIRYEVPMDQAITYVRFQCWGHGDDQAWTQPFFLDGRAD